MRKAVWLLTQSNLSHLPELLVEQAHLGARLELMRLLEQNWGQVRQERQKLRER